MNTSIIAITKPLIGNSDSSKHDNMSAEEFIAYTARVSNPSNQHNTETAPKLLKYLIKHRHWSPYEMVSMTASITTSRGISAQILRHRSFSFSEFSQRYSQATDFITYPARRQDSKNRQNSIDDLDQETQDWFKWAQEQVQDQSQLFYEQALEKQVAKEQARFLLPLSTQTTLYMTGNIRSWITYFIVRMEKSTQKEHRDITQSIYKEFKTYFPNICEALEQEYEYIK